MTSKIIYHDFRNNAPDENQPATAVSLTAAVLSKGRRLAALNNALNIVCITLCGACIGASVVILANLLHG